MRGAVQGRGARRAGPVEQPLTKKSRESFEEKAKREAAEQRLQQQAVKRLELATLRWSVRLVTTQGDFTMRVNASSRGAALNEAIRKVYEIEHPTVYHILDSFPAEQVT